MLADKYKPNSQKSLFHKDVVAHIRKWIKVLTENKDGNFKQIMLLHGPIGCGKSVTVDVLFKQFNVIKIDSDSVRVGSDVMASLVNYNDKTLENLGGKKPVDKHNIVFIDNIELCEKTLVGFVKSVHAHFNVPILLLCNDTRLLQYLKFETSDLTVFKFPSPSLLELNKLVIHISDTEDLKLAKSCIKELIGKCNNDTRQLFFFLDQWKLTLSSFLDSCVSHPTTASIDALFKTFLGNLAIKNTDIDLCTKLDTLFQKSFTIDDSYHIALSEPQTISNTIFQNYPLMLHENNKSVHQTAADISDSISTSNVFAVKLYNDQLWELYADYTTFSCVAPAHYTRQIIGGCNNYSAFKDMSYNFLGSFEEVKRVSSNNLFCHKINPTKEIATNILHAETCFFLVSNILRLIQRLVQHFDSQKKGKNTSKKEKMDICRALENENNSSSRNDMNKLTEYVYAYKLFEIANIDDIYLNKKEFISTFLDSFSDKELHYIDQIDLRILKRLLNIFTFNEGNKLLKSHVEMSLKYHILKRFASDVQKCSVSHTPTNFSLEALSEDLSNIWNI